MASLSFLRRTLVAASLVGSAGLTYAATTPLKYVDQILTIQGSGHRVRVPEGYRLELLTTGLDEPRLLTFAVNGDLFIGSKSGNVYRLAPPYTTPDVYADLGGYPHSVAIRSSEIFVASEEGLYRAPYHPGQKMLAPGAFSLVASIPSGFGHSSRTVAVGPDNRVYVSLGISGNCSNEYLHPGYPEKDRRGGIMVLQEKNGRPHWQTFASGLRNPVGFDWHPQTGVMYASNNGPDHLGFEQPPEYFSRIDAGSFHGMPWFQYDGRRVQRDHCIKQSPPRPLSDVVPPVAMFPARNAPMAVAFVRSGALDGSLQGDAVVALRGSWGTRPSGGFFGGKETRRPPKVVVVRFEKGEAKRVDDLITGFQLPNGDRWARPVGVAIGPDGALYFTSDSETNGLFRLRRVR